MVEGQSSDFAIDNPQVARLAASLSQFHFNLDRFDEPLLYPGRSDDLARVTDFFFFMVAIDHRTHGREQEYRGTVEGTSLRGAELLWALGKRRYASEPEFFTAQRMAEVSGAEVAETFRVPTPVPVDVSGPEERAALLRDAGITLSKDYGGSALQLVQRSEGHLHRSGGKGLLELLKGFRAYSDPLGKKAFLLVKFLERRGILRLQDPENAHVPVDNVLQRVALRTGIVRVEDPQLDRKIRRQLSFTASEDARLRSAVSRSFDDLAHATGLNPTSIDDVFWEFGRIHCTLRSPFCDSTPTESAQRVRRLIAEGPIGMCPFSKGCIGFKNPKIWELREPAFETLYY